MPAVHAFSLAVCSANSRGYATRVAVLPRCTPSRIAVAREHLARTDDVIETYEDVEVLVRPGMASK
jgi:hypothetical protein